MKLKPTPEQIAAFEVQLRLPIILLLKDSQGEDEDLESEMETMTKFDTMAIKTADTFEQEFGSAISSVFKALHP